MEIKHEGRPQKRARGYESEYGHRLRPLFMAEHVHVQSIEFSETLILLVLYWANGPELSKSRKPKPGEVKREKGRAMKVLIFLIPLALGIAALSYIMAQPAGSVGIGSTAPEFQLQVVGPDGLTGETAKLSSFRGNVVLLEFMESWCPYCRADAPAVESVRWDYEPRGVVFISVAGTDSGATAESTAAFIKEYKTQWTYVLDSDNSVFRTYNVKATPTFFVLDKNGVIVSTFKGLATTEILTSSLDAALGV